MIVYCQISDILIPAPQFSCKGNDFWTVFRKDIYNKQDLSKLDLNERQIKAVMYVKEKGKITNSEYQEVNGIGKSVSIDELRNLVKTMLKIGVEEDSKSSRRYVSARFAHTWFYIQLQIRHLLTPLAKQLVNY